MIGYNVLDLEHAVLKYQARQVMRGNASEQ